MTVKTLNRKYWKILSLLLWAVGIILLLPLIFVYYEALQEVTGMVIFGGRNEVLGLSIVGILFVICGGIISFCRENARSN